ncbi:hypothetical protein [Clostridium sp. UBA7503]|uniref:hypothetical protein n=1 Tax=Clostridium sp. UBA7503 TaxID=1946377 RepID=UPI003217E893
MVKEYRVDNIKMKKIIQDRIKKHPKWKKRKWVRYILIFIVIAALIIMPSLPWTATKFVFDGKSLEEIKANTLYESCSASVGIVVIFIGMPVFLYLRSLKNQCRGYIGYLTDEILILNDEELNKGYRGQDISSSKEYYIDIIKYKHIRKLVLNKYYETLDIYGDMRLIVYSDYENDVIDNIKKYQNKKTTINLYYENSEDFIKTLEEKSGIKVQVIDEVDESYNRVD